MFDLTNPTVGLVHRIPICRERNVRILVINQRTQPPCISEHYVYLASVAKKFHWVEIDVKSEMH